MAKPMRSLTERKEIYRNFLSSEGTYAEAGWLNEVLLGIILQIKSIKKASSSVSLFCVNMCRVQRVVFSLDIWCYAEYIGKWYLNKISEFLTESQQRHVQWKPISFLQCNMACRKFVTYYVLPMIHFFNMLNRVSPYEFVLYRVNIWKEYDENISVAIGMNFFQNKKVFLSTCPRNWVFIIRGVLVCGEHIITGITHRRRGVCFSPRVLKCTSRREYCSNLQLRRHLQPRVIQPCAGFLSSRDTDIISRVSPSSGSQLHTTAKISSSLLNFIGRKVLSHDLSRTYLLLSSVINLRRKICRKYFDNVHQTFSSASNWPIYQ